MLLALLLTTLLETAPKYTKCEVDRLAVLALSLEEFDQDPQGGWRALAAQPDCKLAAADLIRDYRAAHGSNVSILFWHEGQLRASAGDSDGAIKLMEQSRKGPEDTFGWNLYVDSTVAFLRRDRTALLSAREALSRIPRPADFDALIRKVAHFRSNGL